MVYIGKVNVVKVLETGYQFHHIGIQIRTWGKSSRRHPILQPAIALQLDQETGCLLVKFFWLLRKKGVCIQSKL